MTSQPGLQTIAIHMLPNISQSQGNQTVRLRQLIEHIQKNIFLQKLQYSKAHRNFLNGKRQGNISISVENENNNKMSFLDVQFIREDKTFTTSVYRQPTFSTVYTHFDSFLSSYSYKFATVDTLAHRCFKYA